ncbi:hypothetical protein FB45DRAFT_404642 [Roridomyces roridus]|uniref:Uncharacterized protein n=1 Tax=Roridomyces roridus TaxID=1738132 RepID=A0AAD7FUD1_9AGAR|nr:hypothetical protein FB45DRAFT_404642 [Roridomyces roridus]
MRHFSPKSASRCCFQVASLPQVLQKWIRDRVHDMLKRFGRNSNGTRSKTERKNASQGNRKVPVSWRPDDRISNCECQTAPKSNSIAWHRWVPWVRSRATEGRKRDKMATRVSCGGLAGTCPLFAHSFHWIPVRLSSSCRRAIQKHQLRVVRDGG